MDEDAPLAVYAGQEALAETHDSPRANIAHYGPLEAASEAEARKHFGDQTTIVRRGLIIGPGDEAERFGCWPVRIARGGEVLAARQAVSECLGPAALSSPPGRSPPRPSS